MVNTDILVQATGLGFTVKEVPVTHFPRLRGQQTGANFWVILRALKELCWLYHKLRSYTSSVRIIPQLDKQAAYRQSPTWEGKR